MKAPLKVSDFSPEDIKMLVDGAQKYLGPLEDPRDQDVVFKRPAKQEAGLDDGSKE